MLFADGNEASLKGSSPFVCCFCVLNTQPMFKHFSAWCVTVNVVCLQCAVVVVGLRVVLSLYIHKQYNRTTLLTTTAGFDNVVATFQTKLLI